MTILKSDSIEHMTILKSDFKMRATSIIHQMLGPSSHLLGFAIVLENNLLIFPALGLEETGGYFPDSCRLFVRWA